MMLWPLHALQGARGLLFPWLPVFMACGIGGWFALPFEPGPTFYLATAIVLGAAALGYRYGPELAHPLAISVAAVAVGVLAIGFRAHAVQAPMLEFRYYGAVQGRIIEVDRSQSDALRITLDRVVLDDVAPDRTPIKVRISLHSEGFTPDPGQTVLLTAHLSAPEGPAEPGGFDFRRMAYFNQLGAVGYARTPVMLWADPDPRAQVINRLRTRLSAALMAAVPGDAGAFSSGVMTGDRSGISLDTVQALRDSNLAHLLAISGMNMAFLTGFVFVLVRYGLALVPPVALRVNAKKLAAVVAFGVALFYLLLSGANVATERAFLMVCVMLGAVLLDRRALTLRSVALAACVLLMTEPESLTEPGFQLSFAATVALIAGFGALDRRVMRERLPRWVMPVFTLVLTSVLAGLATAPYAAAHFNRFTDYGLIANLLTVPVMSVLMAAGAVAALLAPLGLSAPALWVMEASARWIIYIAHWVAGLEGAVTPIVAPGPWVLPLITMAGVWLVLWRGRVRLWAVAPLILGFALWAFAERPALLISNDGLLVGIMSDQGRVVSAPRGAGFAAENWMENDGDLATQEEAAARAGFTGPKQARLFEVAGLRGLILRGKGAVFAGCGDADLVIVPAAAEPVSPLPKGCVVIDRAILDRSGALAGWAEDGKLTLHPTRKVARIWMSARSVVAAMMVSKAAQQVALTAP
jgi:competence protein ComEC